MADSRYGAGSVHDELGTSCHSRASESSSGDSAANLKRFLQVKGAVEYLSFHKANCSDLKPTAAIKIAGETSITSDMQMAPPLWQNAKKN